MKKKDLNKHHMIWKQHRYLYNISDTRNIVRIDVIRHVALHNLFHTLNTPHEQFEYITWLRRPIQSKIIKELTDEINNTPIKKRYDDWLVK